MTNSKTIKPEVGQVWKCGTNIYNIVHVWKLSDGKLAAQYLCQTKDGTCLFDSSREEWLNKYYTYIGKAKGSISDLFEVEDE